MINYGNWQETSQLEGSNNWQNPHRNAFGGLLRTLDPMTYIPGLNTISNAAHNIGDTAVTGINTALSPMIGGAQKLTQFITPGLKQAQNVLPYANNIDTFIRNKPFDAAALAAATYFTGGAAAKGLGAIGAPAASSSGGLGGLASFNAAGSAAITPAFEAGATGTELGAGAAGSTTGALAGASSISPMLASGAYPGIAGASGTGTLGTLGTAAANSLITPGFATLGGTGGYGLINRARPYFNNARQANRYRSAFNQPQDQQNNQDTGYLGTRILEDGAQPIRPLNVQRISRKLTGMR